MIPKQAALKAAEGGWRGFIIEPRERADTTLSNWRDIALDPTFWQALGKALGWQGKHHPQTDMLVLQAQVHTLVDLILTEGDTEKFWSSLLDSSTPQ